jgi:ankyrin repeat protein
VALLLEANADPNYIKSSGSWKKMSMLITAVNNNNFDIAKLLIEHKADVNWRDSMNTTALIYAASAGNKAIVMLLLDNGADINADDGQGNTVLSAAEESEYPELIKLITDKLKEHQVTKK